jgi:hypothetical protein
MWVLILRYGLPDGPPIGDVPPAVLHLNRRDEPRDEPQSRVVAPNVVAEGAPVERAA